VCAPYDDVSATSSCVRAPCDEVHAASSCLRAWRARHCVRVVLRACSVCTRGVVYLLVGNGKRILEVADPAATISELNVSSAPTRYVGDGFPRGGPRSRQWGH
jgi:hypothetical protein